MKKLFASLAVLLLAIATAHPAASVNTNLVVDALQLGKTTNIISDNGTALTRNGVPVGGSGSTNAAWWTALGNDTVKTNAGGKVGIGTNAPSVELEVVGTIKASSSLSIGSTNVESAIAGKQPLAATLTAASTNSFTGTGTIPLTSVTDLLAPKSNPTFTGTATFDELDVSTMTISNITAAGVAEWYSDGLGAFYLSNSPTSYMPASAALTNLNLGIGSGLTNLNATAVSNALPATVQQVATNSTTGTGTIPLTSVTDGKSSRYGVPVVTNVLAFGAVGDGVQLTNVWITNGTALLYCTNATFVAGDVGKPIRVIGAGAGGAAYDLCTTIASIQSTNHITLTDNAGTTITNTMAVYGTDDTAAIQAGIDNVSTNGGGTLFFPRSIYIVNGAFYDAGASPHKNAQLYIPNIAWSGTSVPKVILRGENNHWTGFTGPGSSQVHSAFGSLIVSTRHGTGGTAALFRCINDVSYPTGIPYFNNVAVSIEHLGFRVESNPQMSCLSLGYATAASVEDAQIDSGWIGYAGPEPTLATSVGLEMPFNSNSGCGFNKLDQVDVWGFWTGLSASECTHGQLGATLSCKVGVRLETTSHSSAFDQWVWSGCATNIYVAGTSPVRSGFHDVIIEHAAGGHWYSTAQDLSDASNAGFGTIGSWEIIVAGGSVSHTWLQSGGTNWIVNEAGPNMTVTGLLSSGAASLPNIRLLSFEVATPALGAQETNIVIDFTYPVLELTTSTNMNLSSYNNLPTGTETKNGVCKLKILNNGGANITVNSALTVKIANAGVAFPVVITNGDWGVFSFDAWGGNVTNVAMAYANVH